MKRGGVVWTLFCCCLILGTISESELPIMPTDLSTEIKNETEAEHLGCMKDLVVCIRSHKVLPDNVDVMINKNTDDNADGTKEVCAINASNDVQQFDSVCEIVYSNCVLKRDGYWAYIGDGKCADIMKQADAAVETPPPNPYSEKNTGNSSARNGTNTL